MKGLNVCDHPVIKSKLTMLRDHVTSAGKFRDGVRELASLLVYEASRGMEVERRQIQTPLAAMLGWHLKDGLVFIPILRAGLGMVEGALQIVKNAKVQHVSIRRDEATLQPEVLGHNLPDSLESNNCLILDPMLATGGTAAAAIDLLKHRCARRIGFVGIIGAPEGVQLLKKRHPEVEIWLASFDECLDQRGFILPGLGDAGDRQFGT